MPDRARVRGGPVRPDADPGGQPEPVAAAEVPVDRLADQLVARAVAGGGERAQPAALLRVQVDRGPFDPRDHRHRRGRHVGLPPVHLGRRPRRPRRRRDDGHAAGRDPSRRSNSSFRGRPPPYPVRFPPAPITRWQGTTIGIGLAPSAAPTARAAFGRPMRPAISPYVARRPNGTRAVAPSTSFAKGLISRRSRRSSNRRRAPRKYSSSSPRP